VVGNALGVQWTVHEVNALYPARDLTEGFIVTYSSGDVEYSFTLSADDADRVLLLKLTGTLPDHIALYATQGVPSRLRVEIVADGDSWHITNLSSYHWTNCEAQIGNHKARLPVLLGNGTVVVQRSQFKPPLTADDESNPWIACVVAGTTYIATRSEP
jgi:hypothetical protein